MKNEKTKAETTERIQSEPERKPVADEKLAKVTGGGSFDDVPTVEEHPYDPDTKNKA